MNIYKIRYYAGSSYSENYYLRWTRAEDEQVLDGKIPDKELAVCLGRSINSIQKRRWKLKKEARQEKRDHEAYGED